MNIGRCFKHVKHIKKAANLLAALSNETKLFLINLIIVNLERIASFFFAASKQNLINCIGAF